MRVCRLRGRGLLACSPFSALRWALPASSLLALAVLLSPWFASDAAAEHDESRPGHVWQAGEVTKVDDWLHVDTWLCEGVILTLIVIDIKVPCTHPVGLVDEKRQTVCDIPRPGEGHCEHPDTGRGWVHVDHRDIPISTTYQCPMLGRGVTEPGHCGRWAPACTHYAGTPGQSHRHRSGSAHRECGTHEVPGCVDAANGYWYPGPGHWSIHVGRCQPANAPDSSDDDDRSCAASDRWLPPQRLHTHSVQGAHAECRAHTPPSCALTGWWVAHTGHTGYKIDKCAADQHPCRSVTPDQIAAAAWRLLLADRDAAGPSVVMAEGQIQPGESRSASIAGPAAEPLSASGLRPTVGVPVFGSVVSPQQCGDASYAPVQQVWSLTGAGTSGSLTVTPSASDEPFLHSGSPDRASFACAYDPDGTDPWPDCHESVRFDCAGAGAACQGFAFVVSVIWRVTVIPDPEMRAWTPLNDCPGGSPAPGRVIQCRELSQRKQIGAPALVLPGI